MAEGNTVDLLAYFIPLFFLNFSLSAWVGIFVRPGEKPEGHNATGRVGEVHVDLEFSWCVTASPSSKLSGKIPKVANRKEF